MNKKWACGAKNACFLAKIFYILNVHFEKNGAGWAAGANGAAGPGDIGRKVKENVFCFLLFF
jgi:hypothetical protein